MLGVSCKRVTNMRWQGQLEPVTAPHREIGLFDRAQVEAVAAQREARQFENEMRRAQPPAPSRPLSRTTKRPPWRTCWPRPEWSRENPGPFRGHGRRRGDPRRDPVVCRPASGSGAVAVAAHRALRRAAHARLSAGADRGHRSGAREGMETEHSRTMTQRESGSSLFTIAWDIRRPPPGDRQVHEAACPNLA
jgi:hypothetical protein